MHIRTGCISPSSPTERFLTDCCVLVEGGLEDRSLCLHLSHLGESWHWFKSPVLWCGRFPVWPVDKHFTWGSVRLPRRLEFSVVFVCEQVCSWKQLSSCALGSWLMVGGYYGGGEPGPPPPRPLILTRLFRLLQISLSLKPVFEFKCHY